MSKVNFVSEFNLFMRYACDNSLSLRSRMLWMALFYIANDRAKYNEMTKEYDWPDDFVLVSNNELNMYCCLDKRAIETLRNELKQRGLIDFVPGQKNKRNPAYKLNYLSVNVGYKNVPNYDPNSVPNNTPNYAPNPVPNYDPNNVPNQPPLYKYNKAQGTGIKHIPSAAEEDDDPSYIAYARTREVVEQAYKSAFGEPPTIMELDTMARIIEARSLALVAREVVNETAKAAPRNRLAYLSALCADWELQYIRSPEDLAEYKTLRDMGEVFYPDPEERMAAWNAERAARKAKYTNVEESA